VAESETLTEGSLLETVGFFEKTRFKGGEVYIHRQSKMSNRTLDHIFIKY